MCVFLKQKTAYEVRISDWSSDVCSSDLLALLNTTEDRNRLVGRVRAGLTAQLGNSFALDFRLAGGNARSPVSTNQTLGNYGGRWDFNVDKAAGRKSVV